MAWEVSLKFMSPKTFRIEMDSKEGREINYSGLSMHTSFGPKRRGLTYRQRIVSNCDFRKFEKMLVTFSVMFSSLFITYSSGCFETIKVQPRPIHSTGQASQSSFLAPLTHLRPSWMTCTRWRTHRVVDRVKNVTFKSWTLREHSWNRVAIEVAVKTSSSSFFMFNCKIGIITFFALTSSRSISISQLEFSLRFGLQLVLLLLCSVRNKPTKEEMRGEKSDPFPSWKFQPFLCTWVHL